MRRIGGYKAPTLSLLANNLAPSWPTEIFFMTGANDFWFDSERYKWMAALPRSGWAWELLRRSPGYRGAYENGTGTTAQRSPTTAPDSEGTDPIVWPMVRLRRSGCRCANSKYLLAT